MLLRQDDAILERLTLDQATAVLEEPPAADLPKEVRSDLERFAESHPDAAENVESMRPLADLLADPFDRRQAAIAVLLAELANAADEGAAAAAKNDTPYGLALLKFDNGYQQAVFRPPVRRRLRSLSGRRRSPAIGRVFPAKGAGGTRHRER